MSNLAIYSVFCGHTANRTFVSHPIDPRYPHFFVSNNRELLDEAAGIGWIPVFTDLPISDDPVVSATQSKFAKCTPHTVAELCEFEFLCYKDDKRYLNMDGLDGCVAFMTEANASIGIRAHPFLHENILFEFGESMGQPRYKSQWTQMVQYITEQVAEGYSLQSQLYWTGAILRNMPRFNNRPDGNHATQVHLS